MSSLPTKIYTIFSMCLPNFRLRVACDAFKPGRCHIIKCILSCCIILKSSQVEGLLKVFLLPLRHEGEGGQGDEGQNAPR